MKKEKKEKEQKEETKAFVNYEINILDNDDTIILKNIPISEKTFKHDNETYNIDNKQLHLTPTKESYDPVLFYRKGKKEPIHFKNSNKGIPSRALNLLWDKYLYSVIMTFDNPRINKIVVILLLANAIMFGIGLYLMYGR